MTISHELNTVISGGILCLRHRKGGNSLRVPFKLNMSVLEVFWASQLIDLFDRDTYVIEGVAVGTTLYYFDYREYIAYVLSLDNAYKHFLFRFRVEGDMRSRVVVTPETNIEVVRKEGIALPLEPEYGLHTDGYKISGFVVVWSMEDARRFIEGIITSKAA